ncbi:hypothetical protein DFP72DRAFT_854694 [Ephemerocybe angulata]|uniref:SSD domain-containing protein n=1 Tax=Ephemerocybe angulata TaxID=980116 RepID=A0A8H6LY68_9AGAR|nr:hypothetical protein DFP72DRAFT_854694 [Tulosesus angulatus]
MRALLRPFALHAAYTPIETIVFFCIVGTLAYFHILNAIKHSAFLSPAYNSHAYAAASLRPAYVLNRMGEWVGVREARWNRDRTTQDGKLAVAEVQQLVFNVDALVWNSWAKDTQQETVSLSIPPLSTSLANLTEHLMHTFVSPAGKPYDSICYRPHRSPSKSASQAAPSQGPCFLSMNNNLRQQPYHIPSHPHPASTSAVGDASSTQAQVALAFAPGAREEWVGALKAAKTYVDAEGVKYEVELLQKGGVEDVDIGNMRSGKWVAYAVRILVLRFWALAKKADSLDILLILAGGTSSCTSRSTSSSRVRAPLARPFWLPLAIMSSAVLSLLIAVPVAMALGIRMDPVALTEALPFLVCTVGFDKPLRLARAVFTHPHLLLPPSEGSGHHTSSSSTSFSTAAASTSATANLTVPSTSSPESSLKPAPKIITESLTLVYPPIIRDYGLEIAVLVVGANSKVGGLRESWFGVSVWSFGVVWGGEGGRGEVGHVIVTRMGPSSSGAFVHQNVGFLSAASKPPAPLTRSRSNSFSSIRSSGSSTNLSSLASKPSAMARPPTPSTPTLRHKISSALLGGEKGSSLPEYARGLGVRVKGKVRGVVGGEEVVRPENPVARLKLLLIASFMTLHVLNFIAPLTPSRHAGGNSVGYASNVNVRKVDVNSPGVRAVLKAIEHAEGITHVEDLQFDLPSASGADDEFPLGLDHLYPRHPARLAYVQVVGVCGRFGCGCGWGEGTVDERDGGELFGELDEARWGPCAQQVIVIILAISGIALGVGVNGLGAMLTRGRGGVRFEEEGEGEGVNGGKETSATAVAGEMEVKHLTRRPSYTIPPSTGAISLDDVDKKLKAQRRLTITSKTGLGAAQAVAIASPMSSSSSASSEEDLALEAVPTESLALLNDEEIVLLSLKGKVAAYALEKCLAADLRRARARCSDIPHASYDYGRVLGACCENVIGYIPLPLGVAGPLNVDGVCRRIYRWRRREGTLVASTSRGCKALNAGGGDGMTRGACDDFPSVVYGGGGEGVVGQRGGVQDATGDAMGMTMISKGTEKSLEVMQTFFPEMIVLAPERELSARIRSLLRLIGLMGGGRVWWRRRLYPGKVVKTNLVGSAMAGSVGGFNAHAANILTAVVFGDGAGPGAECGEFAVHDVDGGYEWWGGSAYDDHDAVYRWSGLSVAERYLRRKALVLEMLGVKGAHASHPGQNAQRLARTHRRGGHGGRALTACSPRGGTSYPRTMVHNRSRANTPAPSVPGTPGVVAGFNGDDGCCGGGEGGEGGWEGRSFGEEVLRIWYLWLVSPRHTVSFGKAFKGNEKITELRIWSSEEGKPLPILQELFGKRLAHFPALETLDWNNSILDRRLILGEEGVYDILDWLVEGGAAGSIQCLTINTLFDDELHFIPHFARLEHLSLPGILPSDERSETRLPHLTLDARAATLHVQSPESGKVPWYSELLAGISSPVLSKLWLHVHYNDPEEHPQEPLYPMDWKTLNTLLQTSQSYAQLKELEIYAGGLSGRQRSSAEDCEKWIRKELNGVHSGTRLLPSSLPPALTDRIPQEIYDSVIAAIGGEIWPTRALGAASLVCHAWEASSRSYIFYSFSFTPTSITFLAREAGNRVLMSIRCAKYVAELDVDRFTFLEDLLQDVLPKIPNLHSWAFIGNGWKDNYLEITGDGDGQVFSSFRAFQDMVAHFKGLQTLSLSCILWKDGAGGSLEGENIGVDPEVPSTLRSVDVWREGTTGILLWLSSAAETIRSLQLPTLLRTELHLVPLFTHLEHLCLGFFDAPQPGDLARLLSPCVMLKTLEVSADIVLPPGLALDAPTLETTTNPHQVPWYAELLSSVSSPLSKLSLQLCHIPEGNVDPMGWKILRDLLRTSRYAELKQLDFKVGDYDEFWASRSDCERGIRRELEGLDLGIQLSVGVRTWTSRGFVYHD